MEIICLVFFAIYIYFYNSMVWSCFTALHKTWWVRDFSWQIYTSRNGSSTWKNGGWKTHKSLFWGISSGAKFVQRLTSRLNVVFWKGSEHSFFFGRDLTSNLNIWDMMNYHEILLQFNLFGRHIGRFCLIAFKCIEYVLHDSTIYDPFGVFRGQLPSVSWKGVSKHIGLQTPPNSTN